MLQLLFNTKVGFGKLSTLQPHFKIGSYKLQRSVLVSMMFVKIAYSTNVSSFSNYCWFVNVRRSCIMNVMEVYVLLTKRIQLSTNS